VNGLLNFMPALNNSKVYSTPPHRQHCSSLWALSQSTFLKGSLLLHFGDWPNLPAKISLDAGITRPRYLTVKILASSWPWHGFIKPCRDLQNYFDAVLHCHRDKCLRAHKCEAQERGGKGHLPKASVRLSYQRRQ